MSERLARRARYVVVPVAALLLAGCGDAAGGRYVSVVEIQRPNGGTVECATNDGGGMDCNWDGAR